MNTPLFSIIIPCYNQAHFLEDSVRSVVSQSFYDLEIIIVNDGSTDDTTEVVSRLASQDGRIKLLNKENGGLSSARNAGIRYSKGAYLHFLDSDDVSLPGLYNRVKEELEAIDIVVVGYSHFKQVGVPIQVVHHGNEQLSINDFLYSNVAPPVAFLIRREVIAKTGFFDETLKSAEDWDLWLRAAKLKLSIKSISDILVGYRYVPNSMSRDAFRMYEALKIVGIRGMNHDDRIPYADDVFRGIEVEPQKMIALQLLRCLGLSVMQGKIRESVDLFFKEKDKYNLAFSPFEFREMYSYLSFRYWVKMEEVMRIQEEFYPRFTIFFQQIGLDQKDQRLALKAIFKPVNQLSNHIKFGSLFGKFLNFIQR